MFTLTHGLVVDARYGEEMAVAADIIFGDDNEGVSWSKVMFGLMEGTDARATIDTTLALCARLFANIETNDN